MSDDRAALGGGSAPRGTARSPHPASETDGASQLASRIKPKLRLTPAARSATPLVTAPRSASHREASPRSAKGVSRSRAFECIRAARRSEITPERAGAKLIAPRSASGVSRSRAFECIRAARRSEITPERAGAKPSTRPGARRGSRGAEPASASEGEAKRDHPRARRGESRCAPERG